MKSTVEALDENRVKMVVDVDAEEFEVEVDKAFRKIARDVRMPGFRKGKVPRRVLEARFGAGVARGQALEDSIPDFFLSALNEHEVDIIAPPDYEILTGEEDGPLSFAATVEVRPDVEISDYHGLQVEVPNPDATDEDVQQQIDSFLGQFAELASVDRAAADGDTVTVDITTLYEGEEIDGLTADDYSYRIGTGAPVPELDENLEGAEVGATLEFDADHPDPDEEGSLSFTVVMKDVQEQVLPELTDELVADASDFETVDDFRADLVDRISNAKRSQTANLWREKAAEALGGLVSDDPPDAMVDAEVRNRVEDMAQRLAQSGIAFETYLQMMGQTPEDMVAQMREPAIQAVKVDMGLRALAVAEGLEATEADVEAEFEQLAEGTGATVDDLKAQISTPNQRMLMRADISKRKAAEWLLENVTVVDEDGNPVDTEALEPEPHDHDHAHEEE